MQKKTVSYSRTVMSEIMLLSHANSEGNVHGGEIMKIMDNTAYVVARKHARRNIVTARVDEMQFHQPVYIDNLITCTGNIVFVGKSSMEVAVKVEVEKLNREEKPQTALTAYFTMVAIDGSGKPVEVPQLKLATAAERERYEEGKQRYQNYKNSRS